MLTGRAREHGDIVACAANEGVGAGAANEGVGAVTGIDEVVAGLALQAVVAGCDDHRAVGGGESLEGRDGRVARAERAGDFLLDRVAHDRVFEQCELAVEHRDIDLGGLAGLEAMDDRGIHRDGGVEAGADVADRHADAGGRLPLVAGDAHDAALALHDHVVGGILGVRAGVAEARGRGVDQLGILLVQSVPAVAQLLHRAGAEVLDHDVGLLEQLLEDLAVGVALEVEGDAFLAAVDRGEIGRLAVDEGTVGTGVVATLGRFDLDHPGAHLGHQQGAVGSGQDAGEVDDDDARQGAFGVLGHPSFLASGPP